MVMIRQIALLAAVLPRGKGFMLQNNTCASCVICGTNAEGGSCDGEAMCFRCYIWSGIAHREQYAPDMLKVDNELAEIEQKYNEYNN